jgi:hypothetical protein
MQSDLLYRQINIDGTFQTTNLAPRSAPKTVMSVVNGPPSSNPKVEPVALEEPVAVAPVLEPPVTSVAAKQVSPKEEKKRKDTYKCRPESLLQL